MNTNNEINETILISIKKERDELTRQIKQYIQIWEAHHKEDIRNKIEIINSRVFYLNRQIDQMESDQKD